MASLADLKAATPRVTNPGISQYRDYTKSIQETGFLEFTPRSVEGQAKYDAMQDQWEGIASSEKAIARGDYSLDVAEKTRKDLKKVQPKMPTPAAQQISCVIS